MSMKKTLAGIASYALVGAVALGIGGTLAGLQETQSDVNTFTTEGVSIEQLEYQRVINDSGNFITDEEYTVAEKKYTADALEKFSQNKAMLPVTETIRYDDRATTGEYYHMQPWAGIGAPGANQLFDADIKNVIDKFVFVKNTGESECYYRTVIAVESPKGAKAGISTNTNSYPSFDWDQDKEGNQYGEGSANIISDVEIDGVNYYLMVATYTDPLKPNEISRPSLLQAYMDKEVTNEEYKMFGDEINILVATQATQTGSVDGKTDAQSILNAAFGGPITDTNHPWMNDAGEVSTFNADTSWYYDDPTAAVFTINSADELIGLAEIVNSGVDTFEKQTINLDGNISLAGYDWEPIGQTEATEFKGVFDGQGYTISNLTIDSSAETGAHYSSGLFGWFEDHAENIVVKNVTLENVDITGHHNVGAIVGYSYDATIENCHVINAELTCTNANADANGDKCGGIVGYFCGDSTVNYLKNCTVTDATISAFRDAGQVAGTSLEKFVIDCKATNVTVTCNAKDMTENKANTNIRNELIGRLS